MANKKIINLDLPSLPLIGDELIEVSVGGVQSVKVAVSEALVALYNDSTSVLETTPTGIKSTKTQFTISDNSDNDVIVIDDAGTVYMYVAAGMAAIKAEKIIDGKGNHVGVTFGDVTSGVKFSKVAGSAQHIIDFKSGLGIIRASGTSMISLTTTEVQVIQGILRLGVNGPRFRYGTNTPENAVTGYVGDIFLRTDGGASTTFYVKESGSNSNTGWVGK
jgi:hypothetical protein